MKYVGPMLKRVVGILGLLLVSQFAVAGTTSAKIASILLFEGGPLVYVYPVGGVNSPPSCHGANGSYYSFLLTRPYAKEYLAALLAAQASGATVTFQGTGTCGDQYLSETLYYFTVLSN